MRRILLLLTLCIIQHLLGAQMPFEFSFDNNANTQFRDLCKIDDFYYALYFQNDNVEDKYESAIIKFDDRGEVVQWYTIGAVKEFFMSYFDVSDNSIILISTKPSMECVSSITLSRFDINTGEIEQISTTPMCDVQVEFAHRVDGLDDVVFIDEYHNVGDTNRKNIWRVNEDHTLSKVFENIHWGTRLAVDFSQKGYVLSSIGLYEFYDRNFNYIKQRYSHEGHLMFYWRNTPFGEGLMLEYTSDVLGSVDGIQLRLIDSIHLDIKRLVEVLPPQGYTFGDSYCAPNTGYSITSDKEIWFTGFFNVNHPVLRNATPFMITKVDSSLNIICQHFIIDDNFRIINGLRSFKSGEVAVFGNFRNRFEITNKEEDAFLIVFGENCESPFTTSTEDDKAVVSISAYPNPTVNDLTIRVSGMDESLLRIEFFDRSGKTIDVHTNLTSSIQVHDYLPGQYFYRIMDQDDRILGVGSWVKQ